MPLSKRDKKVSLTKTPKKGMAMKQKLVEDIRTFLDKYEHLFVFTINNMRNGPLKDLREEWKDSRFFFAKRKVMAIALGRTEAEEIHKNIHKLASHLVGQCGLLFTNRAKDTVVQWFRDYSQVEFAKSGFVATETVTLPAGPLPDFSFSLEPHLRSLGLPTQLQKGKIILREDYTVCTQGARLTPEQASILKLFGKQMAEFKVKIICVWSKDGSFEKFKVPKEAKRILTEKNKELHKKEEKKMKKTKESVPENNTEEEITQLFDQQTVKKTKEKTKESTPRNKTEKEITHIVDQQTVRLTKKKTKESVSENKTEEEITKLFDQQTISEPSTHERRDNSQNEEPKEFAESPKITRENPRRSMRTPKPIRRSPEEKNKSVKISTKSNKKSSLKENVSKSTRGTPRKSVSKRIFEEPQDVEMGE